MSSKLLFLFCFMAFGCGVKSPPIPPQGSSLPSYVDDFLEKPDDANPEEQKKNKSSENTTPSP